jgi:glutaredoxin 3
MKKVIIYTISSCIPSKLLKNFLKENNVVFEERDLNNPEFYEEAMEKSGTGITPLIDIDGKIIEGFEREVLIEELNLR